MYSITRSFTFAAAHHLTKVAEGHKCRRVHGHNYTVVIEAACAELNENGMVVDYAVLDEIANAIRADHDHRDLNETCGFETTAENLARFFYQESQKRTVYVTAVTVNESDKSTATFRK